MSSSEFSETAGKADRNGVSRRHFLAGLATSAVALQLPRANASTVLFDHVVVVTMENRSFDHFLGWYGQAGGQNNFVFADSNGDQVPTFHLNDYQGCGYSDPDHSFSGGRIDYNSGACNGWLLNPNNDQFCVGYYEQQDLAFTGRAAADWTTLGRYFAAMMGPTFPNRIYQHAGQTDRIDDVLFPYPAFLPTIWDRLAARGISRRYYYSDLPILALWGSKYAGIGAPLSQFLADCRSGLPAVSFVDPYFLGLGAVSTDDHPFTDIRNGEAFLNLIYQAVTTSPSWPTTLLVITFDEWGGFFDHVPPPKAPVPLADWLAGNRDGLRGFRVPCLLISPWSHQSISTTVFDHTSILRMIEWRWSLTPLTLRDATANNLAEALNFLSYDATVATYEVPTGPFPDSCVVVATNGAQNPTRSRLKSKAWPELAEKASKNTWEVG